MDFAPPAAEAAEPEHPVTVDYVSEGRVAVVTLNRPHADNAITTEMGERLTEILETIAVRPAVRVVDPHRRRRSRLLRRQRPPPAQEHDEGGLASAAPGLRPNAVHAAAAAQANLRGR